jgi:uncharacterized protein
MDRRTLTTDFNGISLTLLPERAIFRADSRTLIVADVHLGKGAAFRKLGVPVPGGASEKDLQRLCELLRGCEARRLIVLGDFIHAKASRQERLHAALADWRARCADVEIILVRGNHDRQAGPLLSEWNISEVPEPFDDGGLRLGHHPDHENCAESRVPTLAGHIHPVFGLRDFDGSSVTTPCFVFDEFCGVLPAFGFFTGGARVAAQPGRSIYVSTGKTVVAAYRPEAQSA